MNKNFESRKTEANFEKSILSFLPKSSLLAVSTYTSNGLIIAGISQKGEERWLNIQLNRPAGIGLTSNSLYVAEADRILGFSINELNQTFNLYADPIDNSPATYTGLIPQIANITGKILCHDLFSCTNEQFYCVNTKYSSLSFFSKSENIERFWMPPFITDWTDQDFCHLNGLGVSNGVPMVVSCLSSTNFSNGWRFFPPNCGVLVHVEKNEIIASGLTLPHSPRCIEDSVYFLQSGLASICTLDLRNNTIETLLELPGFARGLAINGNYAFVGLSAIRNSNLWEDLPIKKKRSTLKSGLLVVDLCQRKIVSSYYFTGGTEEIFDIQIISL